MARKKVIQTVDGICGSGKTHAVLNYIKAQFDKNYLYVCETIGLCNEIHARASALGIKSKLINSQSSNHGISQSDEYDSQSQIVRELYSEIKDGFDFNQLFIITWATYQQINPNILKKFESIFLDDIRQVIDFVDVNLGKVNHVILDDLEVIEQKEFRKGSQLFEYYSIKYAKTIEQAINELKTDFKDTQLKLALKSSSHNLYIEKSKYDRLIKNQLDYSETRKSNQKNIVTIYLSPKDEMFPSNVVIVSEGLDDCNQLARLLRNRGCKLVPHECQQNVTNSFPKNNCKVNLLALSERDISRYLLLDAKCEYTAYINNAEYLAYLSANYMKGKDYIYIVNDHVVKYKKIEQRFANGTKISTVNRGLNCFANYENVVCLTSLNFDNEKQSLLQYIDGIDYEAQKKDGQIANDLQTIFRTALREILRNGGDQEIEVNAILPDLKTMRFVAEKMKSYFEVNCLMMVGYIPAEEKFDKRENNKRYYESKKRSAN